MPRVRSADRVVLGLALALAAVPAYAPPAHAQTSQAQAWPQKTGSKAIRQRDGALQAPVVAARRFDPTIGSRGKEG